MQLLLDPKLHLKVLLDHTRAHADPAQLLQTQRIRIGLLNKRVNSLGHLRGSTIPGLATPGVEPLGEVLVQIDKLADLLIGLTSQLSAHQLIAQAVVRSALHVVVSVVDKVRVLQVLFNPGLHLVQAEAGQDAQMHELQVLGEESLVEAGLPEDGTLLNVRANRDQVLGEVDFVVLEADVEDGTGLGDRQVDVALQKLVDY
jgi:hypothetical protein